MRVINARSAALEVGVSVTNGSQLLLRRLKVTDGASRSADCPIYDLTSPFHGAVQAYGHEKVNVVRRDATLDYLQQMSVVESSLSTVTHLESPASVWNRLGLRSRDKAAGPGVSLTGSFIPCVLVDVSGRYQEIEFGRSEALLVSQTANYIRALRIGAEDLGFLLRFRDLRPFVLLHTRWRRFVPYRGDLLQATRFYPWHRYYLHPYLDKTAVEFLLQSRDGPRARGVGCDLYGLNHPLCDLYVSDRYRGWVTGASNDPQVIELADALSLPKVNSHEASARRSLWPLYCVASEKRTWLLEQCRVPPELLGVLLALPAGTDKGFPYLLGWLFLVPHTMAPEGESVPVHALFILGS